MAYSTFAAIDIGSSCMEMVIYEISRDSGIKKIDIFSSLERVHTRRGKLTLRTWRRCAIFYMVFLKS